MECNEFLCAYTTHSLLTHLTVAKRVLDKIDSDGINLSKIINRFLSAFSENSSNTSFVTRKGLKFFFVFS